MRLGAATCASPEWQFVGMKILVLDDNWPQTAWFIQEMHRQRIEVVYASPGAITARGLGRYCRHRPAPSMRGADYRQFLIDLLAEEAFDLVLPLCEPLQRVAWDLPDPLPSRVFPRANAEQRRLLDDRRAMYALATRLGVPIPRMMPIDGADGLDAVSRDFGWPLVLRGTQGLGGEQVRIVRNRSQMLEAYSALHDRSPEPPFAQEFIAGTRTVVGALLDQGSTLRAFAQRSLETYPAPTGPSIRSRSMKDATLLEHANNMFAALKWDGLALAEFMQGENGEFYLMEINPRPWGTIQVAEVCGVPMIRPFVQMLKGETIDPPRSYVAGRDIVMFPGFLSARIRQGRFPRLQDLGSYLRMIRTIPWKYGGLLWHTSQTLYWLWCDQRANTLRQRQSAPDLPRLNKAP